MKLLLILIILFVIPFSYGLTEACLREHENDKVPCLLVTAATPTGLCSTHNITLFNENGTNLSFQRMGNISGAGRCTGDFNITGLGQYYANSTTLDTWDILIVEGTDMIAALALVVGFFVLLLIITIFVPDQTVASLSSLGMMGVGVWVIINGIGSILTTFTYVFGAVLIGIGFYTIFKVNWENWKETMG